MATTITWLGHSNFFIETPGVNIYIDPFFGDAAPQKPWRDLDKADLVLVTHDHDDHVGSAVDICLEDGAQLGGIVGSVEPIAAGKLAPEHILNGIGFNMGGTLTHKGVSMTMTQAYHSSDSGAPAGYIVRMPDGLTVYHAGDTCIFSGMELWGQLYSIDVALLPVGGVFTMDARQAALACKLLRCKAAVPMHWGTFPVLAQSAAGFRAELENLNLPCRCVEMAPGETVSFG